MINLAICNNVESHATQLKDRLIHLCSSFVENLEIHISIFPTLAETVRHLQKSYAQILVLDPAGPPGRGSENSISQSCDKEPE